MTKYVAYKIEDNNFQFVQEDYPEGTAFTDDPKRAKVYYKPFTDKDFEVAAINNLTFITLKEAISLIPADFFTNRENVTKQAAISFAESIIKLLKQETPTNENNRLMYNAHLQACGNQLLELINEVANDYI